MDLTTFLAQLVSTERVKLENWYSQGEKCFLIFGQFSEYAFLRLWQFFLASQLNFSLAERIYKIHVFDEAFFLLIVRMPYGHQTFQGGDKLRGALTHKYI